MSELENLLIHALAIHVEDPRRVRARATVRLGTPVPGVRVWFESTDRIKRELEIIDIRQSDRLSTITLGGTEEDLQHLQGGMYLYGMKNQNK